MLGIHLKVELFYALVINGPIPNQMKYFVADSSSLQNCKIDG